MGGKRGIKASSRLFLFFVLLMPAVFYVSSIAFAQEEASKRVTVNADILTYDEETGVITGEGGVLVRNKDILLSAPYVEYESENQQISAKSDNTGFITFQRGDRRLSGESLNYNVLARRGYLTHASGKVESFFIKGNSIELFPAEEFVRGRKVKSGDQTAKGEDVAGIWHGVYVTTCDEPKPHYRLQSKEVVVIPGDRVIIRKPRVYMGEHLLYTHPFDYVVKEKNGKQGATKLFPRLGYESSKGAGIGLSGPLNWEGGFVELGVTAWSDNIIEGSMYLEQQLNSNVTLFAGSNRLYNKDINDIFWRPKWGLRYQNSGWSGTLTWSERELVTVEKKTGIDRNYEIWKKPELTIQTPWLPDPAINGHFRLFGSVGRYEDTTINPGNFITRKGAGVEIYGDFPGKRSTVNPFYHGTYWYYDYDTRGMNQQILNGIAGIRWPLGMFDMETAYLRRWVWGSSPMGWDSWENQETVYQKIAFSIPLKGEQQALNFSVRGAWDIHAKELSEMVYQLAYDQHCLLWELVYRDNRVGDEDWVGFKLTIKAYPESGVRLSGQELFEPGARPPSLPK